MNELIETFKQAIWDAGIESPAEIIPDGELHRFAVTGDLAKEESGYYRLYPDAPMAGYFGKWRGDIFQNWCSKSVQSMSPEEKTAYHAKIEAMKRQREEERQRIQAGCRAWCQDTWNMAMDAASDHPYLKRKGVYAYGIKSYKNNLLIPVQDMDGTIHGLQFIRPDGVKKFKMGTNKAGQFFKIEGNDDKIVICEGVATGASIHQATGYTVIVAFDVGNLLPVAKNIRAEYLDAKIIIAADDDHATEGNPGRTKATEAAKAVNGFLAVPKFLDTRGPKDTDFNDMARLSGLEAVRACIDNAVALDEEIREEDIPESIDPLWEYAKSTFPYQTTFPWGTLPPAIADSLRVCAESCATSPTALAGVAFANLASALGRMVSVSPKAGWEEPLLVWVADIRPSGEGKTPGMHLLSRPLHRAQQKSDAEFELAKKEWETAERKTRGLEPKWSRSFYASGLTLEGCRTALEEGHGGLVCTFSELSSFISSQGQYKGGRGDDREAWLVMYDGKPARILRAGKSLTIPESSVSICGGIQPRVLIAVFGDAKAVFLDDGTVFRFLLTYEPSSNYELTKATWSDQHRAAWEGLVNRALKWADKRFESGQEPLILKLSDDAWDCFSDFRNSTFSARDNFPPAFRGFIPKSATYVLRIAGLLHVFEQLSNGEDISPVISSETTNKAISAIRFYLGHTLEALKLLRGEQTVIQQDDAKKHLISVLGSLSRKAEGQGFVTVKDIADGYNSMTGKNETAKRIGSLLREIGLTTTDVTHHWRGVRCEEMKNFLKSMSPKSPSPLHKENQGLKEGDFKNQCPLSPPDDLYKSSLGGLRGTCRYQSPHIQYTENINKGDLGNVGDFDSKQPEKNQSNATGLFRFRKSDVEVLSR